MKSPLAVVFLLAPFLFLAIAGPRLVDHAFAMRRSRVNSSAQQSLFERREAAYRANNIGVALLEQYKAKEAVDSFTRALEIKPDLLIARINLSIALYYLPDADGAKREAQKALNQDPNQPQTHYLLGLIARAQNQLDEAIAEFQSVLKIDADDVGANINVGQIFSQEKKYVEAIAAFRRSLEAEPYNETALYNLGILLTRTGHKEEGQRILQKFQEFKQSGAGTTIGTNYLEGGHYAEAVVSTGIEPELIDRRAPPVHFVDATAEVLPAEAKPVAAPGEKKNWTRLGECGVSAHSVSFGGADLLLFDYDGDGTLDLLDLRLDEQRLYHNEGGRFVDVTNNSGALSVRVPAGYNERAIAGDYDNDGRVDLFIVRDQQSVLLHNDGEGRFSDR